MYVYPKLFILPCQLTEVNAYVKLFKRNPRFKGEGAAISARNVDTLFVSNILINITCNTVVTMIYVVDHIYRVFT